MKVIPKPKEGTASVLVMTRKKPVIKGVGEDNYLFGKYKFIICESISHGQIIDIVLKCPDWESYKTI